VHICHSFVGQIGSAPSRVGAAPLQIDPATINPLTTAARKTNFVLWERKTFIRELICNRLYPQYGG
jgi:hypothetical protein